MTDEAVQCPECSADMFVGAHFCMRCGAPLVVSIDDSTPDIEIQLEPALSDRAEQSSIKLRTAPGPPALKPPPPPPRARADSASKLGTTQPLRVRADSTSRLSVVGKSEVAEKLPLPPLSLAVDFEPTKVAPSSPEPESGPRASSRPSAVPFMEPAGDVAAAAPDPLALPGTMSEALALASHHLPDFSIDDIDDGFASIQDRDAQPPQASADSFADSYADMQSLFADMIAAHLTPIRELLVELDAGAARREWLDLCRPVARALKASAAELPDQQLHHALHALSGALDAACTNGGARIEAGDRTQIREAYAGLARLLPAVSDLDRDRARREPVIVQAIFGCTPGLGPVQRDKLVAAGFTGLSMLCLAGADELSAASGVPLELATRLVSEVDRFKRAAASFALDANRTSQRRALGQLTLTLRRQNDVFEASRRGWSRQEQELKRRCQREREETLAQLNVGLAQLGELDLMTRLEKLPFEHKISELERFLDAASGDTQRLSHASGGD